MIGTDICESMENTCFTFFSGNSVSCVTSLLTPPHFIFHEGSMVADKSENSYYLSTIKEIEDLQGIYTLINQEKIERFLFDNKDLISILVEAPSHIRHFFGLGISLLLELHEDPEEGWDELFMIIKSPYDAEEALSLEEKMFNEWFIDIMNKVQGRLDITEEGL